MLAMADTQPAGKVGFADYYSKRANMSFWPTRLFAYRAGAVLALLLGRIGFSANAITCLSLLVSIGGTALVLGQLDGAVAQALGIFVAMGVGYALDCADGMVARVHAQSSLFGAIFDKAADVLAIVVSAALLAGAAIADFPGGSPGVALLTFGACVAVRLSLGVAMWLKEFAGSLPDRPAPDPRARTARWRLRRAIGCFTDHALYVALVAVSWALGCFWQFFVFYHAVLALILTTYLVVLHRESGRHTSLK